jgi:hypothetical protein
MDAYCLEVRKLDDGPIRRTREGGSEWEPIKIFFSKEMETPTR